MPFIPDEEVERVRKSADIVQLVGEKIPLKKAGRNFKALCPFHQEKSPSFMVNPERQIYHCFGCGEGGNVFSFMMKYDGLEFPQAVEQLAARLGLTLSMQRGDPLERARKTSEKEILFRVHRLVARHFYENLVDPEQGKKARYYLQTRKIRDEMIQAYPLGYALPHGKDLYQFFKEKNVPLETAERLGLIRRRDENYYDFFRDRLIFTIVSTDGKILGFSGRALDAEQEPKYLNSTDSSIYSKGESLLGLNLARESIREKDEVILVEGNVDQLRLYQEGILNVVAPLGTALTERQIRLLARYTSHFVLLFDGDASGQRAATRALEIFLPLGLLPKAVRLPPDHDPDSFVLQQGPKALAEKVAAAYPLLDQVMDEILQKAGGGEAGRGEAVRAIAELLGMVAGQVEKSLYIQKVAQLVGVSPEMIARQVLKKSKKGSNFSPRPREDEGRRGAPIERTLLEIMIAGRVPPGELLQEVREDFSDPLLKEVWDLFRADYERHHSIDVGRLVTGDCSDSLRGIVTELTLGATRWEESDAGVALECVKRFRIGRYQGILKMISREIRDAERDQDLNRVEELLKRKNTILKEMTTVH